MTAQAEQSIQTTAQAAPPAKREPTLVELVNSPLIQKKLAAVASKLVEPSKLAQSMLLAVNRSDNLKRCTIMSLVDCLMVAAQYGWSIGGPRPGMYLVPYGNVATAIPSFYGFQQTARECDQEWEIEAEVVREEDQFRYEKGLNPQLVHVPHDEMGVITHAYAIASSKDGRKKFEVMPVAAIEMARGRSRAKDSGPWVTDYSEMCKKTVVRRLCKYLPSSPKLEQVIEMADRDTDLATMPSTSTPPQVNSKYARARDLDIDGPSMQTLENDRGGDVAKDVTAADNRSASEASPPSWSDLAKQGVTHFSDMGGIVVQLKDKEGEEPLTLTPMGQWDASWTKATVQPDNAEQDAVARAMAAKALAATK